jgi:hypothetical protein
MLTTALSSKYLPGRQSAVLCLYLFVVFDAWVLPLSAALSDADSGEGMKQSKNIQQPQDNCDNHYAIQD